MRLGGRASAAIEVLADIQDRRRPVADALKDWGLEHRFAGSGDRSAIGNLVHDALRRKLSQAWRMEDDGPRAAVWATLIGQWGLDAAALAAEFDGDRHAPTPLDEARLAAWNSRDLSQAPEHVRADVPLWCAPHLEAQFGSSWVEQAAALASRPPLDMRANTLKAGADKVLGALSRFGAGPCAIAPNGLRIEPGERDSRLPNVQAEAAFQKGWFEIQDEGSQAVAALCDARPGENVLDYCAGAGGKTLALAAAMQNRGQIHAHDSDRQRLAPIHERLKRAGARNVQVHAPRGDLSALAGRMDLVVVDAPCSGSGTWRRRPDAKWRMAETSLEVRMAEQDAVLDAAARFVKPGGRIAYITCSMFACENAERAAAFAGRNREFRPLEPEMSALCDSARLLRLSGASVALTPLASGTDGFFFTLFSRTA
jgi:16S rRNA (cytosine967-C5)-methyltransferase